MEQKIKRFSIDLTLSLIGTDLVLSSPHTPFFVHIGSISLDVGTLRVKIGSQVLNLTEKILSRKEEIKKTLESKQTEGLLKISEVAKLLQISQASVRNLTNLGHLEYTRTPKGHRRYKLNAVLKYQKEYMSSERPHHTTDQH